MRVELYFDAFVCLLEVGCCNFQFFFVIWMCIVSEVIHSVHSKLCGCFKLKLVCGSVYVGVRFFYYIGQDLFRSEFNSPRGDLSLVIELSLDFDVEKFSIIKTCNHFITIANDKKMECFLLPLFQKPNPIHCR
jgi:hypothetical protein